MKEEFKREERRRGKQEREGRRKGKRGCGEKVG